VFPQNHRCRGGINKLSGNTNLFPAPDGLACSPPLLQQRLLQRGLKLPLQALCKPDPSITTPATVLLICGKPNHHCGFGHQYHHNTTENLFFKAKIHSWVEDSVPISLAKQSGECSVSWRVNHFHRRLPEM